MLDLDLCSMFILMKKEDNIMKYGNLLFVLETININLRILSWAQGKDCSNNEKGMIIWES